MHLYFYARGRLANIEEWKIKMQNQFLVWERTNLKTNKKESVLVQGSLRPSILGAWEYIFPEEALSEVLSMMGLRKVYTKGAESLELGAKPTIKNSLSLFFLRQIFGAYKIPDEIYAEAEKIPASIKIAGRLRGLSNTITEGVLIHTIGIKKDERLDAWGYNQEML